MQRITLLIPDTSRRTHLFLEVHSVSAVTKFVSTLDQRCYQTELIFCSIRVILGGGGGWLLISEQKTKEHVKFLALKLVKQTRNKSGGRLSDYGPKFAIRLILRRELFKLCST